jgi:integrase
MSTANAIEISGEKQTVWSPTQVQFLYKHKNGRYYVRVFACGKEKWTSLKTKLLSVAKNRMKEHVEAAERQRTTGNSAEAVGRLTFGEAMATYRERLAVADIRPNTKAYREAGLKLVVRSWEDVESLNVRRITSKMVEEWLRRFKAAAVPYVPPGAKTAARNSSGASMTTIKCALDAVRQVLDVAVTAGHLYANPARNSTVTDVARRMFKASRRERAESGPLRLPTRGEFLQLVETIRSAGFSDCKAAADYVQFIAFCGARKSEASNVLWSDIDLARETIHLRVTKNGESRFVPMTEEMRQLLVKMKGERKEVAPGDRVLGIKEAQGFITGACRKLRIQRFTTHALRHLFGTACLEAGVDVRTVAGWLGHKDNGALLLKVYSHVRGQHEAEMIRKVRFAPAPVAAAA